MKTLKIAQILLIFMLLANYVDSQIIDIDFTRDSTYWNSHFPATKLNEKARENIVGNIDNFKTEGFVFKGSFGRFNPGYGVFAQPFDSEDHCNQFVYAFRLSNNGTSYIEFPPVSSAGELKIHCKSGNPVESALFYIEKLENGEWKNIKTMVAPPHVNRDYDVVLRQSLAINENAKLRLRGASKNLHVYSVKLEPYTIDSSAANENKPIRLLMLPDTQTYTQEYPYIFQHQTAWAVNHADEISFLIQVGDITNANNEKQWKVVADAMSLLDGVVPHTFAPGNHDIGKNGSSNTRDTELLNKYMPLSKFSKMQGYGGAFEKDKMDNNWFTFSNSAGYQFLVLALEFAPRDAVLDWAGKIIKKHSKHNVIIATHAYMYSDDKRISDKHGHKWTPAKYGLLKDSIVVKGAKVPAGANDGEEIWNKLVKQYPNVKLVLSGHVLNDGTGLLVSEGVKGNKVVQIMANYQKGVNGTIDGGNGFLRILDFEPENNLLRVKTYSPFIDKYKTAKDQEFEIENIRLIKSKKREKK